MLYILYLDPSTVHTVCFTVLGKRNLPMIKLIFSVVSAASKNEACFKSGQNRLENNHLAIKNYFRGKLTVYTHTLIQTNSQTHKFAIFNVHPFESSMR